MAYVFTDKQNYEDIADAIRAKAGTVEKFLPSEMPAAIAGIKTLSATVSGTTLILTGNGASVSGTTLNVEDN